MIITTHPKFDKHYAKRIHPNKKLVNKFSKRLKLFVNNPNNFLLKDHLLKGQKKTCRSFSITGDIRIIYHYETKTHIQLLDIGTHNQVY